MIWNQFVPDRRPRIILRAENETDVIEAMRFARENRIKVAVRGGGHNWVGFSLRNDSLLIDLGRLNRVAIDARARRATIGPTVVGRDLNQRLAEHGLAFPVGHCPTVALSGFLLSGGLGWNIGAWGPACFSIESVTVVTADGKLVTASESENSELLWAIRGGGPGFFGVVTKYVLKVFSAPQAVTTTNYYFPLQCAADVGEWARSIAGLVPKEIELTIFFAPAPPSLASQCVSGNGFLCIVSATAFVDTARKAAAALEKVNNCPLTSDCLRTEINLSGSLTTLLEMGSMPWPERHRYLADALWTNSPPSEVLTTLRKHFMQAPSAKSQATFVVSTGGVQDSSSGTDGSYSMTGDALMLCYAIWERPEDDGANIEWHRATLDDLDKFAVGYYVGESDIVAQPRRAERSYSKASWQRLRMLRQKYDPEALFLEHFGTSAPAPPTKVGENALPPKD
jgi:FAD/FMN-containing dehydrogenase